jgi:hypothetical protein
VLRAAFAGPLPLTGAPALRASQHPGLACLLPRKAWLAVRCVLSRPLQAWVGLGIRLSGDATAQRPPGFGSRCGLWRAGPGTRARPSGCAARARTAPQHFRRQTSAPQTGRGGKWSPGGGGGGKGGRSRVPTERARRVGRGAFEPMARNACPTPALAGHVSQHRISFTRGCLHPTTSVHEGAAAKRQYCARPGSVRLGRCPPIFPSASLPEWSPVRSAGLPSRCWGATRAAGDAVLAGMHGLVACRRGACAIRRPPTQGGGGRTGRACT